MNNGTDLRGLFNYSEYSGLPAILPQTGDFPSRLLLGLNLNVTKRYKSYEKK
jgi:hypothetical protein